MTVSPTKSSTSWRRASAFTCKSPTHPYVTWTTAAAPSTQNDVDSEEGNLVVAEVADDRQGIIKMAVDTNSVLRLTDEVTVTYIGSDSFTY